LKTQQSQSLSTAQKKDIVRLWNAEYPAYLSYAHVSEFDCYLEGLANPRHFLIADQTGTVRAWLVTFTRGNERWFAMILDASLQGQGIGSRLLHEAREYKKELNGWVIDHDRDVRSDGRPYPSPLGFYLKNGFELVSNVRLETSAMSCAKIRWQLN
jgi:GNAT superfamily N-acetyltransferase